MTLRASPDDHLRWQAFRYVADELGPDERAAFEARLADDPAACAAVAEAVELLGALLALDAPAAAARCPARAWVGAAVALAAAAAVVLAVMAPGGDPAREGEAVVEAVEGPPTIALEDAWSHLRRSEMVDELLDQAAGAPVADLEDWEGDPLAGHEAPAAEDLEGPAPPCWLMAAVALDGVAAEGPQHPLEN